MLSAGGWKKNQPNTVLFVLIDSSSAEVLGLGDDFDVEITKGGLPFVTGVGVKDEIGEGWYSYTATSGEANTSGPVGVKVTALGALQQNLEYVVDDRVITAVPFTYTLTSTVGNVPVAEAKVDIYTDSLGLNIVWSGLTDVFGVARDEFGNVPRLEPGTYYIWRSKPGFTGINPDVEVVS